MTSPRVVSPTAIAELALHRPARLACCLVAGLVANTAFAGEADIEDVLIVCDASRNCSFHVAVRHDDTGWDHYADHWRVLGPDGAELGKRVLHHPHVDEQPFTRSLSGVSIPEGVSEVTVEAHDSVHEYGGEQQRVFVPD